MNFQDYTNGNYLSVFVTGFYIFGIHGALKAFELKFLSYCFYLLLRSEIAVAYSLMRYWNMSLSFQVMFVH